VPGLSPIPRMHMQGQPSAFFFLLTHTTDARGVALDESILTMKRMER